MFFSTWVVEAEEKRYSAANLQRAVCEVNRGRSVYSVAKEANIPYTTLKRHVKMRPLSKTGRKSIISIDDESILAEWIIYCAEKGDPRTTSEIIRAASELLMKRDERERDNPLSIGWFNNFMKRHPEISRRTPKLVTRSSACVTEKDVRLFHKTFTDWLAAEGFTHLSSDPTRWFNANETGFDLNTDSKKRVSVMYTFCADGSSFTPQIIVPKSLSKIQDMLIAINGKQIFIFKLFSILFCLLQRAEQSSSSLAQIPDIRPESRSRNLLRRL